MSKAKGSAVEESSYDVSALTVLEGLDAVRKRPGMYIGSTDGRGLQHCLWEIIDNSVDEALAGFAKRIVVVLHADGSASVQDDGRGIPVDVDPKTGLSGVELVMTKLHAGGKFGGSGYSVSGGLHGVGASVVNALSTRVDVTVVRSGGEYALSFARGVAGQFDANGDFSPGSLTRVGDSSSGSGTRLRFWPDRAIFLASAEFDLEATLTRARQTAFLVPGLSIEVIDERGETVVEETLCYDGGIADFVDFLSPDRPVCDTLLFTGEGSFTESVPVLRDDVMVTEDVERSCVVEVGLRWGVGYDPTVRSFVNIISTPKGGTHVSGFERALVRTVNDFLRSSKVLKANEEAAVKEDILEGLTAVVLVRLAEPQFEGQTKEVLGTAAVSSIVAQVVSDGLKSLLGDSKKRKPQAKQVLEKIATAARARRAARLHRETVRRKNALESSSLPAKLSDCRSDDVSRAELFIIEGDSAGGTVKAARDAEFQALMPIRGKILNTMRASEKQMLDNAECAAIITAIGAGSGRSFDIGSIRYGKLIILADADVDGAHIRCLLLTLCYRYMKPLLENGHVYAAVPPLYRIELSGSREYIYCYSDAERDEHLERLESTGRKIKDIQRYKGLGEMDADQLAETTIELEHRKLRRMTMLDAARAEEMFELLMGQSAASRRDFIAANGGLLDPARIDA